MSSPKPGHQVRFSTAKRLEQIKALLTETGITRSDIAKRIGISTDNRMSILMNAAEDSGIAFSKFARVSDSLNVAEMVYFSTAESRDRFAERYEIDKKARRKEQQSRKSRGDYLRNRAPEIAARAAKRAAEREARLANLSSRQAEYQRKRAEAAAIRAAEAEIAKVKKRQEREAKAAEKKREQSEAKSQRDRLRAETRAAGHMPKRAGTATATAPRVKGPAHLAGDLDLSKAKITVAPKPMERFAPDGKVFGLSSLPLGVYAAPPSSWVKAVTQAL